MQETNAASNEKAGAPQEAQTQTEKTQDPAFFHPVEIITEANQQPQEEATNDKEQKLQEFARIINEETQQLGNLVADESRLMNEVSMSLKQVLRKLHVSFNLPPENLPLQNKARKVILTEEANLAITYEKTESHSAFLADYPPEIVMNVLWLIMPELGKAVKLHRKKLNTRSSFFASVKKELANLAKAVGEKKEQKPQIPETPKTENPTEPPKAGDQK